MISRSPLIIRGHKSTAVIGLDSIPYPLSLLQATPLSLSLTDESCVRQRLGRILMLSLTYCGSNASSHGGLLEWIKTPLLGFGKQSSRQCAWFIANLAVVPLTIFRSNSKSNEIWNPFIHNIHPIDNEIVHKSRQCVQNRVMTGWRVI